MTAPTSHGRPQRVTILRLLFAVLGLAAFVLGYLGLATLARYHDPSGVRPLDIAYNDLQLYVLGSDLVQDGGPFSWQLEFARFAAPLFTVGAVVEAGRVLLASEIRRLRARRARRHAVICGDTAFADALARQLAAGGARVVQVKIAAPNLFDLPTSRILSVSGDATGTEVLRGASVTRASTIYVCGEDDDRNQAVAVTAARMLQHQANPPWIYVQVYDPELCLSLQARRLGAANSNRLRLDYFHVDDLAARALYRHHPLPVPGRAGPIRLMIAGDAPMRRFLLVEAARHWWHRRGEAYWQPLVVDLVAADAATELACVTTRFTIVSDACRLRADPRDIGDVLGAGIPNPGYERVFLCLADESRALSLALTTPQLWLCVDDSLVVPVHGRGGLADAFHGDPRSDLLDEVNGKLRLYPIAIRACDAQLIAEDLTERLARQVHHEYLASFPAHLGAPVPRPALRDWAALPETLRAANRAQVQDFATKLLAMDCVVAPRTRPGVAPIDERHVERLARMEHERWRRERIQHGWRPGVRDDDARRHPDLCDWTDLAATSKERTRQLIRGMPAILSYAGLEIVGLSAPVDPGAAS